MLTTSLGFVLGIMFINRENEISGLVSVLTGGLYFEIEDSFLSQSNTVF